MKQVIVRIRDCRATGVKTVATAYYYSKNQYRDEVIDFVKTLMPHQEIYVKVGNQFSKYISYEEIVERYQNTLETVDEVLYDELLDDGTLNYYIKEYLPRY